MKWMAFAAALALAACGGAEQQAQSYDANWWSGYTAVQEALAADDYEAAASAVKDLVQKADASLKPLVEKAAQATDMASLRTAFKPVSEALKEAELPKGHNLVFCPMAFDDEGAHWVQRDGRIANPYYGAEMLECGAIVRKGE